MSEKIHQFVIDPSADRQVIDFREFGFEDVLLLGRYKYHTTQSPLPVHTHGDLIELSYVFEGKQVHSVEGVDYHLSGGDLFFTWPNEVHRTGNAPEEPGVAYWLILHRPESGQRFLSLDPEESQLLWRQFEDLPTRHFYGGRHFHEVLDRIFAVFKQQDNSMWVVETHNLLMRFLLDTLAASCSATSHLSREIRMVVEKINTIGNRIPELAELADIAGLSLSRFKARFKAEVGITPGDYIMQNKIETACSLLLHTNNSITDVASHVGFSTSQYFSTVFRKYKGLTPSEYRRESARV